VDLSRRLGTFLLLLRKTSHREKRIGIGLDASTRWGVAG
jgi:hypothetical protein